MHQQTSQRVESIQRLLEDYKKSGKTRQQYCEEIGMPVTTLAYYRRRYGKPRTSQLVKVKLSTPPATPSGGFTLILSNGRRIESSWHFAEAELSLLIRLSEAV